MLKYFFVLFFLFSSFLVKAQTYTVSAQQLQTLEITLANYKASRQQAISKANELQLQVETLNAQAEALANSLSQERGKIVNLNELLTKLELQDAQQKVQIENCKTEINELKVKIQKKTTTIVVLISVLTFLILGIIAFIYFKIMR